MNNPKVVYTDLSTYKWNTGYDSASSASLSNLYDYDSSTVWTTDGSTSPNAIWSDFGSAKTFRSVVIDNHNLGTSSGGVISIDVLGTNSLPFLNSPTLMAQIFRSDNNAWFQEFTTWSSFRYWGLNFHSDMTLAMSIGNVFFGVPLEFTTPYNNGLKKETPAYATHTGISLSGIQRTSQMYAGRIVYELAFSTQNDTLRTNFQTFHKLCRGGLTPFYFIDTDSTARYMNMEDYIPIQTDSHGLNSIGSLVMKTQLATY